jgi:hypothetical protein
LPRYSKFLSEQIQQDVDADITPDIEDANLANAPGLLPDVTSSNSKAKIKASASTSKPGSKRGREEETKESGKPGAAAVSPGIAATQASESCKRIDD